MRTSALCLAWCVLLTMAHVWNPDRVVLDLPISMFLDGSVPLIGYLLFAVLIVAATPSISSLHDFVALGVIGFGYLYSTVSLYREFLEWNDPFMRSIHRPRVVSMKIPLRDLRVARIWKVTMGLHQGVLLLAVLVHFTVYRSEGLLQKFIVTHLLLLMAILEVLPRRRCERTATSRLRRADTPKRAAGRQP